MIKVALLPKGRDMLAGYVRLCLQKLQSLKIPSTDKLEGDVTHIVASLHLEMEDIRAWALETSGESEESAINLDSKLIVTPEWLTQLASKQKPPDEITESMDWRRRKAQHELALAGSDASNSSAGFRAWVELRLGAQGQQAEDATSVGENSKDWKAHIPKAYEKKCSNFLIRGKYLGLAEFPPSEIPKHDTGGGANSNSASDEQHSSAAKRYDMRQAYACFKSGTEAIRPNMNERLTSALEPLVEYYDITGEEWRKVSFKKAVDILRSLTFEVTSSDQLRSYKGMGGKILKMIDEALQTGHIRRAEEVWKSELALAVRDLQKVHGIGTSVATELYKKGFHSIADLRANPSVLNPIQQIGLQYLDDIQERIPRAEVDAIGHFVRVTADEIWPEKALISEICGSYRRGKSSSGDVDIIISTPNQAGCPPLRELVAALHMKGFLQADLGRVKEQPINKEGQVPQKQTYMGICRLPGYKVCRRLDIKFYPRHQFPFALLYFTGSDHFNRSMRNFAKRKGYSMSDEGIFQAVRAGKDRVSKRTIPVASHCRTEQDVFRWLGFPYKKPSERNCYDQESIDIAGKASNSAAEHNDAKRRRTGSVDS